MNTRENKMLMQVKVLQLKWWMEKEVAFFNTGTSVYDHAKIKPIFNRPGWYCGVFDTPIENVPYTQSGNLYKISWFEREDGDCYSSKSLLKTFEYSYKHTEDAIITQEESRNISGVLGMKGITGTTRKELMEIQANHRVAFQLRAVCRNARLFRHKALKSRGYNV